MVGELAGPYRQLLDPDLVIPGIKLPEAELEIEELTEPLQEALFEPRAWSLGVPAWLHGQVALAKSAHEKAPDIRCQGLLTRPGPGSLFGLGV